MLTLYRLCHSRGFPHTNSQESLKECLSAFLLMLTLYLLCHSRGFPHTNSQESLKERLSALFDAYARPLLRFVRKEVREACPTPDGNAAVSFMRLWASLAEPLMGRANTIVWTLPFLLQC
jgi:hypothetical protein